MKLTPFFVWKKKWTAPGIDRGHGAVVWAKIHHVTSLTEWLVFLINHTHTRALTYTYHKHVFIHLESTLHCVIYLFICLFREHWTHKVKKQEGGEGRGQGKPIWRLMDRVQCACALFQNCPPWKMDRTEIVPGHGEIFSSVLSNPFKLIVNK